MHANAYTSVRARAVYEHKQETIASILLSKSKEHDSPLKVQFWEIEQDVIHVFLQIESTSSFAEVTRR